MFLTILVECQKIKPTKKHLSDSCYQKASIIKASNNFKQIYLTLMLPDRLMVRLSDWYFQYSCYSHLSQYVRET